MTIWKYSLETTDRQVVRMPKGATILSVQLQQETPMLWALVNPDAELTDRVIFTAGTGHVRDDLPRGGYAGTYQLFAGGLVFHVFAEDESEDES